MFTVAADRLTRFATELLAAGGVSRDEAALVAESLVGANLRGHDSHGVMRIPYYLDGVRKGDTLPGAAFTIIKESPSLLVADGHWGFGQTQCQRLTKRLIVKAKETGVAVGTLIHSCHVGRLGEYCELAAREGLVSQAMVNTHGTSRRMAPPGGKAPRLGTNPIAMGVPTDQGTLLLDFGTTAIAEGKVRVKRIAGETVPPGLLNDSEGRPTTDPNDLYADPPGTILPLGGAQAYKGFALALMVEIFSGALSGGMVAREVPANQLGNCAFVMLIDPEHLGGAEHFQQQVAGLVQFLRSCPTIDGVERITLPGDPESACLAQRSRDGVTFDAGNWNELVKLAAELNVAVP